MMKRKDYKKPTMKVVELQQRCQILAGSDPDGFRNPYDPTEW